MQNFYINYLNSTYFRVMSQIQTNSAAQIQKNSIFFTQFYQLLQKAQEVIIPCGPSKAGKSVTVDLLTDKVLQKVENEDDLKKYVAQENNFNAEYNSIYFQYLQHSKTLVLEGFTLDIQKTKMKVNLIKSIFIRTCLQANKKIAFVIVVDQTVRQQLEEINQLLLHFVQCLNIQNQIAIIKSLSQNIYLLLAKTEEANAAEEFLQNCEVIEQQTEHEGIKNILTKIRVKEKVFMFPNDDPEPELGQKLRKSLLTKFIERETLQKLNKTQFYPPFLEMLSNFEKTETIDTFDKLLKLINSLASLLLEKTKDNKPFLNARTALYKEYFDKQLVVQNLKKTNWQGLKKLSAKQKINKQTIQKTNPKTKGYMLLIENVLAILKQLDSKSQIKNLYDYFIGTLTFIKYLAPCIDEELISNNLLKLVDSCRNLQILCGQNQSSNKQPTKELQMSKVSKKSVQKKGVNKTATIFKDEVMNLKNNEQVIKLIINKIKQKETLDNFEPSDVIYHIKCLRQLLQSYDSQQKSENRKFIQELLDIYAFNQNLYEFETNLKKYILKNQIPLSSVQKLIKKADQLKSYQNQVRLINYLIANTYKENQFLFLNKMKDQVRLKQHQQFLARSKPHGQNKETVVEKKTYCLGVSFENIKKKADSSWLNSQSFKRIIEVQQ